VRAHAGRDPFPADAEMDQPVHLVGLLEPADPLLEEADAPHRREQAEGVLAAERRAIGFVLGLPINMDGSEGPRAQSTRAFARNLAKLTALPIALWDERLSTAAVERELIAKDVSRAKRAAIIDEHAAIFILQGALDRLANLKK